MQHTIPKGLVAAAFTPFKYNTFEIDLSKVKSQAEFFKKQGVKTVVVAGTTGESLKLAVSERKLLAEEWIRVSPQHDITCIVHVGHNCTQEAVELAKHAEKLGAAGILAMSTPFFKPLGVTDLVKTMAVIAKGAPKTPFFYYHIPSMAGAPFVMRKFLEEVERSGSIPTLCGVKFTDFNLCDFTQCVHFKNKKYAMFFGRDSMFLGAMAMGAEYAIGSTYNYNGDMMNQIIQDFESGDIKSAREKQHKIAQLVQILYDFPGRAVGKAIMKMKGLDVGPPRLPTRQLTQEEYDSIQAKLTEIGIISK